MAEPDLRRLSVQLEAGEMTVEEVKRALRKIRATGDVVGEIAALEFLFVSSTTYSGQFGRLLQLCEATGDTAPARRAALAVDLDRELPEGVLQPLLKVHVNAGEHRRALGLARRALSARPEDAAILGLAVEILDSAGEVAEAREAVARYMTGGLLHHVRSFSEFAPYAAEYYQCAQHALTLPLLKSASAASYCSAVFNTDRAGYRYTVDEQGRRFSPRDDADGIGNAVLAGGSTSFGIGATSDATSLASLLSRGGRAYYNLGAPSYVIQQTVVQAVLETEMLDRADHAVVLFGANELASMGFSPIISRDFGSYFGWNAELQRGAPHLVALPEDYWPRSGYGAYLRHAPSAPLADEAARAAVMSAIQRAMYGWRRLARGCGFELTFALQPISVWLQRNSPEQERRLLDRQNELMDEASRGSRDFLARNGGWFRTAAQRLADDAGIRLVDLNEGFAAAPERDEHLFIDYCHLTDLGHALAADLIIGGNAARGTLFAAGAEPALGGPAEPQLRDEPAPALRRGFVSRVASVLGRDRIDARKAPAPLPEDNYPLW